MSQADQRAIVLIGAGKIGMGYVADVFDNDGYHLVFINRSPEKVIKMNEQGFYTIYMENRRDNTVKRRRISDYEAYSYKTERDQCVKRLTEIDLVCVQIYPNGAGDAMELLADAIKLRVEKGINRAFNIMFCVNFVYPSRLFREGIDNLLDTEAQKLYLRDFVGFQEGLTYRGGTDPTPEMLAEDPLMVAAGVAYLNGEVIDFIPMGDTFVGDRPDTKALRFIDKAEGRVILKVWCGNMAHCYYNVAGYFFDGALYAHEAAKNEYGRFLTQQALYEAVDAVGAAYGFDDNLLRESRQLSKPNLNTSSPDRVARIANDPIRKLARNDRFTGIGLLCLEKNILPYYIARGAALMFLYDMPEDANAVTIQNYIAEHGIIAAIDRFCELDTAKRDDMIWRQLVYKNYLELIEIKKQRFIDKS